jgi:phosphatidylinositol-3-phosphatase
MATRGLLATLACFACAPSFGATHKPTPRSHLALIVLENHEYGDVIGNPDAPFLNRLARHGALATHYYAISHPSLPNYLALLGGSTFGVESNCIDCTVRGPSLVSQLSKAGVSWRAYMGDMPHRCFAGAEAGSYVKRHNPFMYFPSITSTPERCNRVMPEARLDADLRRRRLPSFSWISPNLCDNGHNCGIGGADRHLSKLVPRLTRRLGPDGFLAVTFDEGRSDLGCCGAPGGGRVMTVLTGPAIRDAAHLSRRYNHYSLLATIEDAFGLPHLRHARDALRLHR